MWVSDCLDDEANMLIATEMPHNEQFLYIDLDHFRFRNCSGASVTKDVESSQCSNYERA